MSIDLLEFDHWIFDLDGTLTKDVHDFDAIRAALGLPPGRPILETIATLPAEQADELHRRLDEIEWQLTLKATPQPGARKLLLGLQQRGARMGILTRNSRRNACATLNSCGLSDFFESACVLGRESAAPKPDPEGIHKLLAYWEAHPRSAVMVGDYLYDLAAGRNAGTATVFANLVGNDRWVDQADLTVQHLDELYSLAVG